MSTEPAKKIIQQIRKIKCSRKGCCSQQLDPLEVVWVGQQYGQNRDMTCSACFICNDQAIKNSRPTTLNILPVSQFIDRLATQLYNYELNKKSKDFFPKIMEEKQKEINKDIQRLDNQLNQTLRRLAQALVNFCKRVEKANIQLFKHQVFEQIISMNTEEKYDALFDKIIMLIKLLNCGKVDNTYYFLNMQQRRNKQQLLLKQIQTITQRTMDVLNELYESIKRKNLDIARL